MIKFQANSLITIYKATVNDELEEGYVLSFSEEIEIETDLYSSKQETIDAMINRLNQLKTGE